MGKIDRGLVSVNAYGVYESITFPLVFKIFKPKGTLKESNTYKTKIELASSIVTELIEWMIIPWLDVFPDRSLLLGFHRLIAVMNQFYFSFPDG